MEDVNINQISILITLIITRHSDYINVYLYLYNGLGVKFHPVLKHQYIKNYLPQNFENLPQVTLAIF